MMKTNGILVIIIIVFEFIFDWQSVGTRDFSNAQPNTDPVAMPERNAIGVESDLSSDVVDEILRSPIFVEGRLGVVGDAVSETMIFINGTHTPVELIGTIWSGEESTAAFSLGDEKTVWLGRSERLGDWQIDEIKQQFVRLSTPDETLVLQQRKDEDSQPASATLEPPMFQPDAMLIN